MRQSTRLIVNTLAAVSRLLLTFVFGLVTTRVLLRTLEFSDFGLLTSLGASGVLLMLISQSMAGSAQRHLAYEIGRDDDAALRRVFNTTLALFAGIGLLVALAGLALAPLVLRLLTIPAGRADAAWMVFHLVLGMLVLTVLGTPFKGLLIARQELVAVSAYEILESVLRLAAVLSLALLPGDLLVVWTAIALGVRLAVTFLPAVHCLVRFPESRPRPRAVDRRAVRRIAGYAGWATLGNIAMRLRSQGGLLLLNVSFDEVISGGYAIAARLSTQQTGFALAFQRTVQPAIVSGHARGETGRIHTLGMVADKYLLLALSFGLVPLWLDTGGILRLWLGAYPPYTAELTRLVLIYTTVPLFTRSFVMALRADGDIGPYTRTQLALAVLALVLAAFWFEGLGLEPWALPVTSLVMEMALTAFNVVVVGRKVGMRAGPWVAATVRPVAVVTLPAALAAAAARWTMEPGPLRLLAITLAYAALAAPLTWWVGLESWERRLFVGFAGRAVDRARGRSEGAAE